MVSSGKLYTEQNRGRRSTSEKILEKSKKLLTKRCRFRIIIFASAKDVVRNQAWRNTQVAEEAPLLRV